MEVIRMKHKGQADACRIIMKMSDSKTETLLHMILKRWLDYVREVIAVRWKEEKTRLERERAELTQNFENAQSRRQESARSAITAMLGQNTAALVTEMFVAWH